MSFSQLVTDLKSLLDDLESNVLTLGALTNGGESVQDAANKDKDARTDRMLEEYKFLRTEIEAIWTQTYTTLNFLLAFSAILLGAAFSRTTDTRAQMLLLLAGSAVTIGGYKLIEVHSSRVWRITTYMRLALEPHLEPIGWETRLAARHVAVEEDEKFNRPKSSSERALFDAHGNLLDFANVAFFVALVGAAIPGQIYCLEEYKQRIPHFVTSLVPILVVVWARWSRPGLVRGGSQEHAQTRAWKLKSGTSFAYSVKPGVSVDPDQGTVDSPVDPKQ